MNDAGRWEIMRLIHSGWHAHAIYVFTELGIADYLTGGAAGSRQLSKLCNAHEPSLRRLLRATVTLNLCTQQPDGSFAATSLTSWLGSEHPESLRPWVLNWGRAIAPTWRSLLRCVQTGHHARADGDEWARLAEDPTREATVNAAMANLTTTVLAELLAAIDVLPEDREVVDIGGGSGQLIGAILARHPRLHGTLLDRPTVAESARTHFERCAHSARTQVIGGDFFAAVPRGGDIYLLKSVLHDWDDAAVMRILQRCRQAMSPKARLIIIERLVPTIIEHDPVHRAIAAADLNLLVTLDGCERTLGEFQVLLAGCGLAVQSVKPAGRLFFAIAVNRSTSAT